MLLRERYSNTTTKEEYERRIGNGQYKSPLPSGHKSPVDIWENNDE